MFLGTQQLAELLNAERWQVQRVIELGEVPTPSKIGGRWIISGEAIPKFVDALRSHGWLTDQAGAAQ